MVADGIIKYKTLERHLLSSVFSLAYGDGGSITISYKALIFRRLSNISFCSVQNPCKIIFDSQIHAKQADRSALFFMMDKERAYSKRVGFVLLFQIVDSVLCFLRGEFFPVLGS